MAIKEYRKDEADYYAIRFGTYGVILSLEKFKRACGRYPMTEEGLSALKLSHDCGYEPDPGAHNLSFTNGYKNQLQYQNVGLDFELLSVGKSFDYIFLSQTLRKIRK